MLRTRSGFNMFVDGDLGATLQASLSNLVKRIESDPQLGSPDEETYIARKMQEGQVSPLTVDIDDIKVSQSEVEISGREFGNGFFVDEYETYTKPVITFRLPFKGEHALLKLRPSSFTMWTEEIDVSDDHIIFEVVNFDNNVETLQKHRDEFLSRLQGQFGNINKEVEAFNNSLADAIKNAVKRGKANQQTQTDILSQLGKPIK